MTPTLEDVEILDSSDDSTGPALNAKAFAQRQFLSRHSIPCRISSTPSAIVRATEMVWSSSLGRIDFYGLVSWSA